MASYLALGLLFLSGVSSLAQSAGCSAADQSLTSAYSQKAVATLQTGDLRGYLDVMQDLDRRLSAPCLTALARQQPARVGCTADEKRIVLAAYKRVLASALNPNTSDLARPFRLLIELEGEVSSLCWISINTHTDPRIREACSSEELNFLASLASRGARAGVALATNFDTGPILQIQQMISARVSEACMGRIMALQAPPRGAVRPRPGPRSGPQLPSVHDHGGSVYSMTGVGACTPSGCVAF